MTAIELWEMIYSPFNPWKEIDSHDPRIGPATPVIRGDKTLDSWAVLPIFWKQRMVLQNENAIAVHIGFRTTDGLVKYHREAIKHGDTVAMRIGPEDVEFLFVFLGDAARLSDGVRKAPTVLHRQPVSEAEFYRRFSWFGREL